MVSPREILPAPRDSTCSILLVQLTIRTGCSSANTGDTMAKRVTGMAVASGSLRDCRDPLRTNLARSLRLWFQCKHLSSLIVPAQAQRLAAQHNLDVSGASVEQGSFPGIKEAFLRTQRYGGAKGGFRQLPGTEDNRHLPRSRGRKRCGAMGGDLRTLQSEACGAAAMTISYAQLPWGLEPPRSRWGKKLCTIKL